MGDVIRVKFGAEKEAASDDTAIRVWTRDGRVMVGLQRDGESLIAVSLEPLAALRFASVLTDHAEVAVEDGTD